MDPVLIPVLAGCVTILLGAIKLSQELWRAFRRLGQILDSVENTEHLVSYHLGPNHGTKPIHERLTTLESEFSGLTNRL